MAIGPRLFSRRFAFALATAATLGYKCLHIFIHTDAIPTVDLWKWGSSFYFQDSLFLILLRVLIDGQSITTVISYFLIFLATLGGWISITFFLITNSELQWRNLALAGDSSSWVLAGQGIFAGITVTATLFALGVTTQSICYPVAGLAAELVKWPFIAALNKLWPGRSCVSLAYSNIPQKDLEGLADNDYQSEASFEPLAQDIPPTVSMSTRLLYKLIGIILAVQALTTVFRPADGSLAFMSWTICVAPYVELMQSAKPSLAGLLAISSNFNGTLGNATALTSTIEFSWLPKDTPLKGFDDWYTEGSDHYSAALDPLKLTNINEPLIPALRDMNLNNVPIRNVMLIKMESSRKDTFPFKRGSVAFDKLSGTHENNVLPKEALEYLSNVTPNAKFLTGDHDDGFEGEDTEAEPNRQRGGINVKNAFTTSTYTLKSLTGTLCGISPLAADFNQETEYHIYQPCLPHVFEALNHVDHEADLKPNDGEFTSLPWTSKFFQSVTFRYDKQDRLMPMFGYTDENLVDWWTLTESPKYGPVNISDVNYYGMPEIAVEDYIRNAFIEAKENGERLFLSHLTSTTHHAFGIPDDEENYVPLTEDKEWTDLSHYMNAVHYVDGWLGTILDILDETGVANETLLILVGDHGLSIAERGTITPYANPHVGNYHVPLVLSHPKLPQIDIDDAVSSIQILPTILDMLIETGSLSKSHAAAAGELVRNYEGQSLIRPMHKYSEQNGQGAWQFTVMNPGGSTVAVRDARQPDWRLIVPVFGHYEWRFTDLSKDPHELDPLLSFELAALVKTLENGDGTDAAANWVQEAAVVTNWWAADNYKRWRYE